MRKYTLLEILFIEIFLKIQIFQKALISYNLNAYFWILQANEISLLEKYARWKFRINQGPFH